MIVTDITRQQAGELADYLEGTCESKHYVEFLLIDLCNALRDAERGQPRKTLAEAITAARGGPAPVQRQGFA